MENRQRESEGMNAYPAARLTLQLMMTPLAMPVLETTHEERKRTPPAPPTLSQRVFRQLLMVHHLHPGIVEPLSSTVGAGQHGGRDRRGTAVPPLRQLRRSEERPLVPDKATHARVSHVSAFVLVLC